MQNKTVNPEYLKYVQNKIHAFFCEYRKMYGRRKPVFVCIGDPDVMGDAIGPIIGRELQRLGFNVYGTIMNPVHATNINNTYRRLWLKHFLNSPIISIDASISTSPNGYIEYNVGKGLAPGAAFGKDLGVIGNSSIKISTATTKKELFTADICIVNIIAKCVIDSIAYELSRF